jgi:hypothetical protein
MITPVDGIEWMLQIGLYLEATSTSACDLDQQADGPTSLKSCCRRSTIVASLAGNSSRTICFRGDT